MATENKGVMVYLPQELEAILEKYCIERNITRKTRDGHVFASLGTGIVQYLKTQLLGNESNLSTVLGTSLTKDDVLELIRENDINNVPSTVPDSIGLDEVNSIIDRKIESLVLKSTDTSEIEQLRVQLVGLETHSQTQFKEVLEELQTLRDRLVATDSIAQIEALKAELEGLKQAVNKHPKPDKNTDSDTRKTWVQFFKMVELPALNATEAQKEANNTERSNQIEMGIAKAKELGLGEWKSNVDGRDFIRVDP
jgi:hypothetical protein